MRLEMRLNRLKSYRKRTAFRVKGNLRQHSRCRECVPSDNQLSCLDKKTSRKRVDESGLSGDVDYFRFLFSYTVLAMFHAPSSGLYLFLVACKGCYRNIPAPIGTIPDSWIVAECPLSGAKRRYLPADIFNGRISHELRMQPRARPNGGESWGK